MRACMRAWSAFQNYYVNDTWEAWVQPSILGNNDSSLCPRCTARWRFVVIVVLVRWLSFVGFFFYLFDIAGFFFLQAATHTFILHLPYLTTSATHLRKRTFKGYYTCNAPLLGYLGLQASGNISFFLQLSFIQHKWTKVLNLVIVWLNVCLYKGRLLFCFSVIATNLTFFFFFNQIIWMKSRLLYLMTHISM